MSRCNALDTHELLKNEIYSQKGDDDASFRTSFSGPVNIVGLHGNSGSGSAPPQSQSSGPLDNAGFQENEIYFDSTARDSSSIFSNGEIKWAIAPINNGFDVQNIVELSLGSFYFPRITSASATSPDFFYFRRVYMFIESFPSTQAVLGPSGNNFHFEFDVNNATGQAVFLTPVNSSFFFQRPQLSLSNFNVVFLVPPNSSSSNVWTRVPLPHDTVSITSLTTGGAGYNPIRFQINGLDTTAELGPIGSTGTPGLAVFITGYNSNSAAVNTLVNNPNGNFITNIIDNTTFEIGAINGTPVTANYTASMYIPKNRIAFRVRFSCLYNQLTNYVQISHN
jgi:hypothetical protein